MGTRREENKNLHAGKIIQNAYIDLGMAFEKTLQKKHRNMIKNARKQLNRLLNSGENK